VFKTTIELTRDDDKVLAAHYIDAKGQLRELSQAEVRACASALYRLTNRLKTASGYGGTAALIDANKRLRDQLAAAETALRERGSGHPLGGF
jgi:hypothetical protein